MTEIEEANAILEEVLALPTTHPRVRGYIRQGIAAELKTRRNQYRKWVKQGRADKIPDENVRREEIEWQERLEEMEFSHAQNMYANISGIVKEFEKNIEQTILGKWMVNGKALGFTTPEQLLAAAADEDMRADGHVKNGKFYREIAKLGHPGAVIAMTVTPEKAEQIRSSIFGDFEMEQAA